MAHFCKKEKRWRGDVCINGKRYTKFGFSSKEYAKIWEGQMRHRYERKILDLDVDDNFCINQLTEKYLEYSYKFKKLRSAEREKTSLNNFKNFCQAYNIFHCCDIEKDTWKKYIKFKDGVSNRTINIDLQTIKRMFAYAIEDELVSNNPFFHAKMLKEKRESTPQYFTPEQVAQLQELMKNHIQFKTFRSIFYVLVTTGIRSNELCTLKKSDINFELMQITIKAENTKKNYSRVIPINEKIADTLRQEIDKNREYVFTSRTGRKYTNSALIRRFRRILLEAEKKGIIEDNGKYKLHTCRSTYVSNLIMAGVEPQKVMRVVGHKEWATVKKYLHLAKNYGNDIADRLPY